MTVVVLQQGALTAVVSTAGGVIRAFRTRSPAGVTVPLLRETADEAAGALGSACYPLVPFGNRVRDNRFRFGGNDYRLAPNTDWDPHRVHGEGWISEWHIDATDEARLEMSFTNPGGDGTPYRYRARQTFALTPDRLSMTLEVTNLGDRPLPFGLGWHPYFPMTPRTTLEAPYRHLWTEEANWLAGERTEIPETLDFSAPRRLPRRWVNNGLEAWSGTARIDWPERSATLTLTADPLFRHAFLFVGDRSFDPVYDDDYFCFEPMSHLADGHNLADLGGLKVLAPGESLSGGIRLVPHL